MAEGSRAHVDAAALYIGIELLVNGDLFWNKVILMHSLDTIKTCVVEVAKKNGAVLAVLFGSYARGTATERSDVDLFFVENTGKPFLRRIDPYFDELSDRLRSALDVLVYTPHEFSRMKGSFFLSRALREGVILYESR